MKPALRTAALVLGAAAVILFVHAVPALAVQDKEKEKDKDKDKGKDKAAVVAGPEVLRAEGELTKDDPKDKERTDSGHHLYSMKLVGGKTYVIDCKSKDIDSYLRLEDAAGKKLDEDDDGGGYPDARIVFKCPKSDTYRIVVTTYDGKSDKSFGSYELKVSLVGGGATLAFKNGKAQVDGQLAATDKRDKVRQQMYCKEYTLRFKKGKTYQMDMVSGAIDSYLRLEDANGQQLAEDDDGGGFPNARIMFNCQNDGVYRIICTSFAQNATGPYTLTVAEQ
jgi:serine protease Do